MTAESKSQAVPSDGPSNLARSLYVLVAGSSVSSYGTFLNMVALNLFTYQLTGSAALTGLFLATRLGVSLLVSFGVPFVLRRLGHRSALMVSDLSQAAALVALITAPEGAATAVLLATACVAGAGSVVYQVALRSCIPSLVGPDRVGRANSLLGGGRSVSMIAGFGSAGLVVAWGGYEAAFLVDAATFAVSAVASSRLPLRRGAAHLPKEPTSPASRPSVRSLFGRGLGWNGPMLTLMIGLRLADTFGSSSHNVALPVYATQLNADDPARYSGMLWMAWAVGSLAVQLLAGRRERGPGGEFPFALGTFAMSVAFILVFCGFPLPVTLSLAVLAGAADGFTEVTYLSSSSALPRISGTYLRHLRTRREHRIRNGHAVVLGSSHPVLTVRRRRHSARRDAAAVVCSGGPCGAARPALRRTPRRTDCVRLEVIAPLYRKRQEIYDRRRSGRHYRDELPIPWKPE
jgi:hypothetical protein